MYLCFQTFPCVSTILWCHGFPPPFLWFIFFFILFLNSQNMVLCDRIVCPAFPSPHRLPKRLGFHFSRERYLETSWPLFCIHSSSYYWKEACVITKDGQGACISHKSTYYKNEFKNLKLNMLESKSVSTPPPWIT